MERKVPKLDNTLFIIRPRGKESTKVRITQSMGKLLPKIEEITIVKAYANTQKLNRNILMVIAVFRNH
jgi:hypothetical protein